MVEIVSTAKTLQPVLQTDATGTPITPATSAGVEAVLAQLVALAGQLAGATPAGSAIIGKVGIDQTTPGATNLVAVSSSGYAASATFTPAASSHTAGDVVGGAQQFAAIGPAAGGEVVLTYVDLRINSASAQATAWRLHLYNVTPPSALADDAAWDFADADRTAYLGYVDIPSTATDIGANQWVEAPIGNKQITVPSGGAVWSYLVDLSTLTTPAVAHVVRLHGAAI